jgi:hypothetical protein
MPAPSLRVGPSEDSPAISAELRPRWLLDTAVGHGAVRLAHEFPDAWAARQPSVRPPRMRTSRFPGGVEHRDMHGRHGLLRPRMPPSIGCPQRIRPGKSRCGLAEREVAGGRVRCAVAGGRHGGRWYIRRAPVAGWTDCDERARADADQRIGLAPRNRDPREAQAGALAGSSRTTASPAAHDRARVIRTRGTPPRRCCRPGHARKRRNNWRGIPATDGAHATPRCRRGPPPGRRHVPRPGRAR